jgi:hypothetical protein
MKIVCPLHSLLNDIQEWIAIIGRSEPRVTAVCELRLNSSRKLDVVKWHCATSRHLSETKRRTGSARIPRGLTRLPEIGLGRGAVCDLRQT